MLACSIEASKPPLCLARVHLGVKTIQLYDQLSSFRQVWGHNLQVRHQINLLSSSLNASIRSVSWHTSNDKILVGTAGTETANWTTVALTQSS